MICDTNHNWTDLTSLATIAQSGGFVLYGPHTATDTFFAFKKTINGIDDYGWFKFSIDLLGSANAIFTLESYTELCAPNAAKNYKKVNLFKLQPTLTNKHFSISSEENHFKIEIINHIGQSIYAKGFSRGGLHNISLEKFPDGHYFVRYVSEKGSQVIRVQKY